MELRDIYDKDRNKTGRTIERGSNLSSNDYHMIVHVCIFNSKGEMLIQQRQPFKKGWPDMWDVTVGGSAIAGESSQSAAERETLEEIGCELDLKEVRPHLTINFERGFDDFYLVEKNIEINKLQLQDEEVKQVKWASKNEIIKMLEKGEFIPYYQNLIELLFEMRKRYGAHSK